MPLSREPLTPTGPTPATPAPRSAQGLDPHSALAALTSRLPADASAAQVADASQALWLEIDQALHPIIGRRGVAALYSRSLQVAAASFACLEVSASASAGATLDPAPLRTTLAQQDTHIATEASLATLQALQRLLCSLVGLPLTERLLLPVWGPSPQDCPAQTAPP